MTRASEAERKSQRGTPAGHAHDALIAAPSIKSMSNRENHDVRL